MVWNPLPLPSTCPPSPSLAFVQLPSAILSQQAPSDSAPIILSCANSTSPLQLRVLFPCQLYSLNHHHQPFFQCHLQSQADLCVWILHLYLARQKFYHSAMVWSHIALTFCLHLTSWVSTCPPCPQNSLQNSHHFTPVAHRNQQSQDGQTRLHNHVHPTLTSTLLPQSYYQH